MYVCEAENLKLVELGQQVNRGVSGLSQAAGRLQRRLAMDKDLAVKMKKVRNSFSNMKKSGLTPLTTYNPTYIHHHLLNILV